MWERIQVYFILAHIFLKLLLMAIGSQKKKKTEQNKKLQNIITTISNGDH